MPDPKLSPAEVARLKAETYAPLVEADLRAIGAHVSDGTLPEERLTTLIAWIESGAWSGAEGASCCLDAAQRRQVKRLAARAIHARGGVFRAGGMDWRSDDGAELKSWVPGGKA